METEPLNIPVEEEETPEQAGGSTSSLGGNPDGLGWGTL